MAPSRIEILLYLADADIDLASALVEKAIEVDGFIVPVASKRTGREGSGIPLDEACSLQRAEESPRLIVTPMDVEVLGPALNSFQTLYLNAGLSESFRWVLGEIPPGRALYLVANLLSRADAVELLQSNVIVKALIVESLARVKRARPKFKALTLVRSWGFPVGYLCPGSRARDEAPVAIGLGASTLVISIRGKTPRVSAEGSVTRTIPGVICNWITAIRRFEASLDEAMLRILPAEHDLYDLQRPCLVAARDVRSGEVLSREMLIVATPYQGLSPDLLPHILGSRLAYDVPQGQSITFGMLDWGPADHD